MLSELLGALVAVGLGYWAYSDARRLQGRGVKVGRFSPLVWGFCVGLVVILFGVLYLRQRSRALSAANAWWRRDDPARRADRSSSPTGDGGRDPESTGRDRVCSGCGHELSEYVASFCPKCGKTL